MAEIAPAAPAPPAPGPASSRLRRLPGTSPSLRVSRVTPRSTLWMDDTQLVQESVKSYTQEIHRFALADIQAIQFRRTPRGLIYNLVLGVPCILLLLLLATIWNDRTTTFGDRVGIGSSIAFFAVFLVVNLLRGPTCRATLTTALGPQILPSLSRVRPTRRAILLIAAGVAAIQGSLRPDEAALEVDRARVQSPPAPAPAQAATFQNYNY